MPKIVEDKPYANFTNRQLAYVLETTPRQVSKWRMGQMNIPNGVTPLEFTHLSMQIRLNAAVSKFPVKHSTNK